MGLLKRFCVVGIVLLIVLPTMAQLPGSKWNIFNGAFTEPFEIMYILYYDGDIYKFDTGHGDTIEIPFPAIVDIMESDGKKLSGIAMMIHNHWGQPYFSDEDKKVYTYLKGKGFKGRFLLYCLPQHIIKEWDGKTTRTIWKKNEN